MKKIFILIFALIMVLTLSACGIVDNNGSVNKTGEDYELQVWQTFWEGASKSFDVEYSEYKTAHTVYNYIQDFTTSDGYTAHYYLIKTAFETKNALGQNILHPVTARCYYVPDYSNTVYVTYMTLDGEVILFDEEKENWLMDIGGGNVPPADPVATIPSDKDNSLKPNDSQSGNSGEAPTQPNNNGNSEQPVAPHTHSYGSWKYYDGLRHYRSCSSCTESEYTAHAWNSGTTTQKASCTKDGTITYACTVCNAEKHESIPMVEHKWDNGIVTQNATCSKEGVMTYFCSSCVAEKYDSIPKVPHEFDQKATESSYLKSRATYTSGSIYYYSCSCGEKGTNTFSLDDRKVWISAEQLEYLYGYRATWIGEYIWLTKTDWSTNTRYDYQIYGSPPGHMENDFVYEGTLNGNRVRFKYSKVANYNSANLFFYYDDLVAAGII